MDHTKDARGDLLPKRDMYGTIEVDDNEKFQSLRQQESSLNDLSGNVETVRHIATQIQSEVDLQNDMLDDQAIQFDNSSGRVARMTASVEQSRNESPYTLRMFCLLLWPLVLLIVLIGEAVLNFLF